jgi:capsular exopolysaccharide synthesis family protein
MTEHDVAERPSFRTAWSLVRRRWPVMLPFLLIPLAALAFSLRQEKQYTASASFLFSDSQNIASGLAEREAATNVELLSLDVIQRRVQQRLAGGGGVADDVEVKQQGQANVLVITATDRDPRVAARTANAYADEYIEFRRDIARREILEEQRFVRSEIERLGDSKRDRARARELGDRLRRLEFDEAHERGGTRLVSAATPPGSPSSPKTVRNTVIGGIVALCLAILTAVLFERLDPRVSSAKEVEMTLGRPIVGVVHKSRALARSPARRRPPPTDLDDFLALRAHLRYLKAGDGIRSVLVTSSSPGDGKTTIAWNLAWAATGRDSSVLLVEADLRNPILAHALGAVPEKSLVSFLDGGAEFHEVTQQVALPSSENGRGPSGIVVVAFAGTAPARSTNPLDWERLGAALREAEREFDLVVVDTAPTLVVPDAIPLLLHVDGVVVVGRVGSTPRAALARLREQLDTIGAPIVGAVVNAVSKDAAYDYGYYVRRT